MKAFIFRFILFFGSLIFFLALGEAWVRYLPFVSPELIGPRTMEDPDTLFRSKPFLDIRHRMPSFDVTYHTNSLGLRDREFEKDFSLNSKALRVLCLGDSFTFGIGVEDQETFPTQLEEMLKDKLTDRPVEVINAGQPAWGTSQQLRYLEMEGFKFNPDLLMVAFFENDLDEDSSNGIMTLEDGQLKRNRVVRQKTKRARKFTELIPMYQFLSENSYLFNMVRRSILIFFQKKDKLKNESQPKNEDLNKNRLNKQGQLSYEIFKEIKELCKNKTSLLILLIPSRTEFELSSKSKIYPIAKSNFKKLEIPFLDLKSALTTNCKEKGISPLSLYIPNDGHFTKEGNQMVAQILKNYILKNFELIFKNLKN